MPELTWLGDAEAKRAARRVPYRLLETQSVHGDSDADNWLIQGDNLEALKSLLPFCAGRVKCIFIDPPYNTKSAFEHYDDNLEHSQWLSMIYPRLELLRDLLAEDGSIWVTIDDNEGHYLKVVMDEVFGRRNFVANAVWQKKYTIANDAKWLADNHDHLLIYARRKETWRPYALPRSVEMDKRYRNPDNHPNGPWRRRLFTQSALQLSENLSSAIRSRMASLGGHRLAHLRVFLRKSFLGWTQTMKFGLAQMERRCLLERPSWRI
ncbi:MAG: site-specific DNA-methyltransferase [Chromatiales bacterium]|nr:site-specific DNA-methyltransferase [Chromatiales bacterium]